MACFPNSGMWTGADTSESEIGVNAETVGVNAVEISGLTPWKNGR